RRKKAGASSRSGAPPPASSSTTNASSPPSDKRRRPRRRGPQASRRRMELAERIRKLPPYLFVEISRKIAVKRAEGVDIVTFGIGDPDIPTPRHILDALHEAVEEPANHRYPESEGLPELRRAVAAWYERPFGLGFDPDKEV